MKEYKNIEKLFHEKLKNLEVSPDSEVWEQLAMKINQRKRKFIPWWFYTAAASVIIIGLLVSPIINDTKTKTPVDNPIVLETEINPEIFNKSNKTFVNKAIDSSSTLVTTTNRTGVIKVEKLIVHNNSIIIDKNSKNKNYNSTAFHQRSVVNNKLYQNKMLQTITSIPIDYLKTTQLIRSNKFFQNDFLAAVNQPSEEELLNKKNNWEIAPIFAVINSNSFTKTSPIEESLSQNKQTGNNSFSYGLKVAYQLTNRWSIQTGIQLQEMNYTTHNTTVISQSSANEVAVNNTVVTGFSFIGGRTTTDVSNSPSVNNTTSMVRGNSVTHNVDLNQVYGYVEVPIELKYNLASSTKINTHIVLGFSSLFLNKNEIRLRRESLSENIGEVNNLNNVNFSGNFGVDVSYKLNKQLNIYLNPMLKKQLQTFTNNANGFDPFTIGIYTGINYKF